MGKPGIIQERNTKQCDKCNRNISLSNFNKHYNHCRMDIDRLNFKCENNKYYCLHCSFKNNHIGGMKNHIWRFHSDLGIKKHGLLSLEERVRNKRIQNKCLTLDKSRHVAYKCKVCGNFFMLPKSKKARTTCFDSACKRKILVLAGRKGGQISATKQNKRSKNEIFFADLCKSKFQKVICNEPIFNGWDAE
jgi:hypothetical protein